jgi:hypothetical protein
MRNETNEHQLHNVADTGFLYSNEEKLLFILFTKETKFRGFIPQANYTDRVTAARRKSYCQLLRIEVLAWSAQRIPRVVNLGFLAPEPRLFRGSRSPILLTRLSGSRSRTTTSQKIW